MINKYVHTCHSGNDSYCKMKFLVFGCVIVVRGTYLGTWMRTAHSLKQHVQLPDIGDQADNRIKLIQKMLCYKPSQRYRMGNVCAKISSMKGMQQSASLTQRSLHSWSNICNFKSS